MLTIIKHFAGTGASEDGRDGHARAGEFAVFPNNNYAAHLIAFYDDAFNLSHSSTNDGYTV